MRRAEARLSASISKSSCIKCTSTGSQVGCTMKTSAPRTFSSICTYVSPSENLLIQAWPIGKPRNSQMSLARASFAVPEKIFHLSSWRARCGLRSDIGFCCATGGLALPACWAPSPSPGALAGGTTLGFVAASIVFNTPRDLVWFHAGFRRSRQPSAVSSPLLQSQTVVPFQVSVQSYVSS